MNIAIATMLASANGRRRERIASTDDVARLIDRARAFADGEGIRVTFGTVPNSYTYPAKATVVVVARVGQQIRIKITEGKARKVAGGGSDYVESHRVSEVKTLLASSADAIVLPI